MSGLLQRQYTMDEGLLHLGQGDGRKLGNGHNQGSALQFFGQAKKKINDIFGELSQYVGEANEFLSGLGRLKQTVVEEAKIQAVGGHREKVQGIREVLARDHMKVAFFGRTSNGKSSVINAMLKDKILPSGIGHTTHCFIQVEGCDTSEGFLLTEDSQQPKSITNIKQLAHALSSARLKESSLIRILWPKEKCRLLREDVVFVDSPGIDVSPDLDLWIDKFCLDADVFILVGNAESTLMNTEKKFFHKVSERLSKPNIFILLNRWDQSALEEDAEEVRQQHMQRNTDFLQKELKVVQDHREAENHVFFISAREALISRLHQDRGTPTPDGTLQAGHQVRLFEFANFEAAFEECISKTAVKTKFDQHTQQGKAISQEVRTIMEDVYTSALQCQEDRQRSRQEHVDELQTLEQQLSSLTVEVKAKIQAMVEDVASKVSMALNDEIRRLSLLVEDFNRPFHPDPLLLNVYKKELHAHVEQSLAVNLQGRCSAVLLQAVSSCRADMTDRLSSILPEEKKKELYGMLPKHEFEIAYRLDCRNLCVDFHEDIDFHFSLSPTRLLQKILGNKSARSALMGTADSLGQGFSSGSMVGGSGGQDGRTADNEVLVSLLSTFASLSSRTTLGAVVIAGVVAKATGWRVIALTGAVYGLVYLYERVTWTSKAKERAFKQQYVDYASSKLRLIVDLTSSNCSHQVQQELSATFARLCHQADATKGELEDEVRQLDSTIGSLRDVASKAKTLRNKADWIDSELTSFAQTFLKYIE